MNPLWLVLVPLVLASAAGRWTGSWAVVGILVSGGAMAFAGIARRVSDDRWFVIVIAASYLLRSSTAILLFTASSAGLPLFREVQLGNGFWAFARDATTYHASAVGHLASAGRGGWLSGSDADTFAVLVAWLYAWFTPHPLVVTVLGVWAATATALLAFVALRSLGRVQDARAAAAAVALWPSSVLWSSQMLKDPVFLLLVFVAFAVAARLAGPGGERGATLAVWGVAAVAAGFLMMKLRSNATLVLWFGTAAGVGVAVMRRPRIARVTAAAAVFGLVTLGVVAGSNRPLRLPLPPGGIAVAPEAQSAVAAVTGAPGTPGLRESASDPLWARLRSLPWTLLGAISRLREVSVRWGGTLATSPEADLSTPLGLLRYGPEMVAAAIFSPYPWRWGRRGETGAFRVFASLEVVLIAILLPAMASGAVAALRSGFIATGIMLVYGVVVWILVGLTVVNEGSLFRLRLQGLLPVLAAGVGAGGLRIYEPLFATVHRLVTVAATGHQRR